MGRKNYNRKVRSNDHYRYSRNEYIKAQKLLVIDEDGTQLGVLDKDKAIKAAQEKGLDLIEVAPNADPPVAKIYSWSKFKYEQSKKRKESRKRAIDQKEMWFKSFIDKGDLYHKIKKVKEFLAKKHPVKITIRAKGRVSREQLLRLMDRILELLKDVAQYEEQPKYAGRNLTLLVRPLKQKAIRQTDEKKEKDTQSNSKTVQVDPNRKTTAQAKGR